jgi:predicted anti-sigma-YlaC factor YlaD
MSCEDFDVLMADALGGELAESDRARFEGHLAFCAACRDEYQSLAGAVDRMRSLPGSSRVSESIEREALSDGAVPARRSRIGVFYRYAASVLLAFGAGYVFRGESGLASPSGAPVAAQRAHDGGVTLGTALVSAHQKRPGGSGLSAAMTAMFSTD